MNIAMMGYYPDFNHNNMVNIDFRSSDTILEYDMLIINFEYLFNEYEQVGAFNGISKLTEYESQQIVKDINRRKCEIQEFLKSGRNILIISPYKDVRVRYTGVHSTDGTGRNARTTNYVEEVALIDSLPIKIKSIKATGTKTELYEKNIERFYNKYKNDLEYNSYFDIEDCSNPLINVVNTSKIVSNYEKYEKGIILSFPNHHFEDSKKERAFFNDIYELMNDLNTEKKEELPQWIENYNTEEEKNTKLRLSDLKDKVTTLNKDISKTQDSIEAFKEEKRIFIESGDVLENIVKEIFDKMGYKIIKFGGNQEDLVISHNNETFVIEIKGLDGSAAEKNAAQALKWKTNYYIDTGIKPKGVLIVNAFKNKELKDRGETFPNQMLKYAEHEEICLLSSVQLYNIYNKFLENEISKEEITEDMKNTNGIYAKYKDWNMFLENNSK